MKRTIYVVDDQPEVLETTVMILRALMPDAEVTGFTQPRGALAAVQTSPPDLILTDQLMPDMRGGELLEEVRRIAPSTLRVVMSGYVSLDKLTTTTSAHQYMAKPFDGMKLKAMLARIFAAQERFADAGLRRVVTEMRTLPSLPQVHQTLLAELEDNRNAAAAIGQMVAQDAGLSAKVLQLANSPLLGRASYLITSPAEAVLCLGTTMIAAVSLGQTLFKHFDAKTHPALDLPRLWNHCWETAALAQAFCREQGLPRAVREEAFLAGLLHETGRLILIDNFPDKFQEVCDAAVRANVPLGPRLREAFQASPAQAGGYLLDLWGMPENVAAAVSLLDAPEDEGATQFSLAAALYIGDHVATLKYPPDPCPPMEWKAAYVRSLGCAEDLKFWLRDESNME